MHCTCYTVLITHLFFDPAKLLPSLLHSLHACCCVLMTHNACLPQVQVPDCPNVLSAAYLAEVAAGENVTVCSEQEINLNGSAIALYNDTSYYDDLTFAATWLYKATGDTDYLSQAETWYVAHLYGTTSTSSVRALQPPFLLLPLPSAPFPPPPTPFSPLPSSSHSLQPPSLLIPLPSHPTPSSPSPPPLLSSPLLSSPIKPNLLQDCLITSCCALLHLQ